MNILYISYDGMTDPLGQSQVLPYLVGLSNDSIKIFLVSCEKKERFAAQKSTIVEITSKAGIQWIPLSYTKNPPILSTLWDLQKIRRTAFHLHRRYHIDIVHCRSYIAAIVGLQMKKELGVRFIFDMRGFYADERVDGKIWNLSNPVFKAVYYYFKKKEKQFFEQADYSISLTYAAREIVHNWKNIRGQPVPIEVIPCCADLSLFNPNNVEIQKIRDILARNNLKGNEFILSYIGSLGTWYMPEEMMRFFKRLLLKKPDAIFFIVTHDHPKPIFDLAKKFDVPEKNLRTAVARRTEVPAYISISTVSIFFIKPVFSKKASSPTKQGEIMGMGVPIICNSGIGDTDMVIKKYQAGWVVEEFSDAEFDKVIGRLDISLNKASIIQGANEFYALQEGVKRYRNVYNMVENPLEARSQIQSELTGKLKKSNQ